MTWALMAYLANRGLQVQHFLSRACFTSCDGALGTTGLGSRHLDSWLMSRDLCRDIFAHAACVADVSIVEGCYRPDQPGVLPLSNTEGPPSNAEGEAGLDVLGQWLGLPRIVVLDARTLLDCKRPHLPGSADAILIDQVADASEVAGFQTHFAATAGLPVLGALESLPEVRSAIGRLPGGAKLPPDLYRPLLDSFSRFARPGQLRSLATSRGFPAIRSSLFRGRVTRRRPLRVAVAYDEVFHCYFPDTLEALESLGASVVDFSPRRDERLPANVDIVYFGCGHPDRWAHELAANFCMMSALRNHARQGRRIYAEGGGLAYLCQELITSDGQRHAMVGLLPARAWQNLESSMPHPVELRLARPTWLAESGTALRGYLNTRWRIEPVETMAPLVSQADHACDLLGFFNVVGSRVLLDFAARPEFLRRFFAPCRRPLAVSQQMLP